MTARDATIPTIVTSATPEAISTVDIHAMSLPRRPSLENFVYCLASFILCSYRPVAGVFVFGAFALNWFAVRDLWQMQTGQRRARTTAGCLYLCCNAPVGASFFAATLAVCSGRDCIAPRAEKATTLKTVSSASKAMKHSKSLLAIVIGFMTTSV
jgi:hypothetical protein